MKIEASQNDLQVKKRSWMGSSIFNPNARIYRLFKHSIWALMLLETYFKRMIYQLPWSMKLFSRFSERSKTKEKWKMPLLREWKKQTNLKCLQTLMRKLSQKNWRIWKHKQGVPHLTYENLHLQFQCLSLHHPDKRPYLLLYLHNPNLNSLGSIKSSRLCGKLASLQRRYLHQVPPTRIWSLPCKNKNI